MARKSRWQQFSDNFNSVYDTFNKAAQNIETSRIMNDDKFTGEGGLGAGLEGSALEKARYKALGDIYTKYGNAEKGLQVRNQLATLDANERENTINQSIMQELMDQRGYLQSTLMRGQTAQAYGSAANSNASANSTNALLPGQLANQGLTNQKLSFGIERDRLMLPGELTTQGLANDQAAFTLGRGEALLPGELSQQRATETSTLAGAGLTTAQTGQLETLLPGKVAEQLAGLELTEAQTNRIEELLSGEKELQGAQLQTALANMGLTIAQTAQINALLPGKVAQQSADTELTTANATGQVLSNNSVQLQQEQAGLEAGFLTQISSPDYWTSQGVEGDPTDEQRTEALLGMYQSSNIPLERQMAVEGALNKHGIDRLQNSALEITQKAKNALQTGGVRGVISYYDTVDDGDDTNLSYVETADGIQVIQNMGEGQPPRVVFSGATEAEIEAQVMGRLTDPGTGMEIAAAMLDMRQKAAAIDETTARTGLIDIQTFTETFAADAVQARTNLVNAQTDKVRQEIDSAKGGLTVSRRIAEEGLAALIRSDAYLYMGDDEAGLAQQAAAVAQYRRTMGMEPAPPTQKELDAMTPEQRALFE